MSAGKTDVGSSLGNPALAAVVTPVSLSDADSVTRDVATGNGRTSQVVETSRETSGSSIPIDARLLTTVVHDIRNPLNVIGLTLRVIEQMPPSVKSPIQEDLDFLRENFTQIERILTLLSDFSRLHDSTQGNRPQEFDPGRFLEDVMSERGPKSLEKAFPAKFELDPSTPGAVTLNPTLTRFALVHAIGNAALASSKPIRIVSRGTEQSWIVEITVEQPSPPSVKSQCDNLERYERLVASVSERRGLDLAMAATICERLGGAARFEIESGQSSTIVLELPVRQQ